MTPRKTTSPVKAAAGMAAKRPARVTPVPAGPAAGPAADLILDLAALRISTPPPPDLSVRIGDAKILFRCPKHVIWSQSVMIINDADTPETTKLMALREFWNHAIHPDSRRAWADLWRNNPDIDTPAWFALWTMLMGHQPWQDWLDAVGVESGQRLNAHHGIT